MIAERTHVIVAKATMRQALRDHLGAEIDDLVTALGVTGLSVPVPDQYYDTTSRTTLFQFMGQRNEMVSTTIFQSQPSENLGAYSGSPEAYTELRDTDFTIVTAHGMIGFEPISFYGKTIEEMEEAMALRSDIYTGAILECLRNQLVDGSGDVLKLDEVSTYAEIDTPPELEGRVALATLRVVVTQEVLVPNCQKT